MFHKHKTITKALAHSFFFQRRCIDIMIYAVIVRIKPLEVRLGRYCKMLTSNTVYSGYIEQNISVMIRLIACFTIVNALFLILLKCNAVIQRMHAMHYYHVFHAAAL